MTSQLQRVWKSDVHFGGEGREAPPPGEVPLTMEDRTLPRTAPTAAAMALLLQKAWISLAGLITGPSFTH